MCVCEGEREMCLFVCVHASLWMNECVCMFMCVHVCVCVCSRMHTYFCPWMRLPVIVYVQAFKHACAKCIGACALSLRQKALTSPTWWTFPPSCFSNDSDEKSSGSHITPALRKQETATPMTLDGLVAFVNSLHDYNHRARTNFTEPTEFKHHSYDALTSFLQDVEGKCSSIMRLYSVGKSVQQRELWVMEVTDNPGQHEPGKACLSINTEGPMLSSRPHLP